MASKNIIRKKECKNKYALSPDQTHLVHTHCVQRKPNKAELFDLLHKEHSVCLLDILKSLFPVFVSGGYNPIKQNFT